MKRHDDSSALGIIPVVGIGIAVILAAVIGVAMTAWLQINPTGEEGNALPERFDYSLKEYEKIDPAMIHFSERWQFPAGLDVVRAIAVDAEDQILVAGDQSIRRFSPEGVLLTEIPLRRPPQCMASAPAMHVFPGRLYVGMADHVEVFDAAGGRRSAWRPAGPRSRLTSVAVAEEDVFVADAGTLAVWRYNPNGRLLGRIGERDSYRGIPPLIVPSPYFDVALAPDGLLRVVNPGMHKIEAFTFDGHLELSWGWRGMTIDAFCGCCNPSHIAIFPDGRVATSEKGILRVKVYSDSGEFQSVVVGPDVLAAGRSSAVETRDDLRLRPADLAIDRRSRLLVLDPAARCVRIFEERP
jgi:hypothetical protein